MKLDKLIIDDTEYSTEVPENSRKPYNGIPDPCEIRAFIPGVVVDVKVSKGDRIMSGDVLILLDAMKMHNEICSTIPGYIKELYVKTGDTVQMNHLIARIGKEI